MSDTLPAAATQPARYTRYKCHKEVFGLLIREIRHEFSHGKDVALLVPQEASFEPVQVTSEWAVNHNAVAPGYFVIYDDGYQSWSPVEAFEKGYLPVGAQARLQLINQIAAEMRLKSGPDGGPVKNPYIADMLQAYKTAEQMSGT